MKKRKTPPLSRRPGRALGNLLLAAVCALLVWGRAGFPVPDPVRLAREIERQCFLPPGEVLTTLSDEDAAHVLVRGTDGVVRVSDMERTRFVPFLYTSDGFGLRDCENLDDVAYYPDLYLQTDDVFLAFADERVSRVQMEVRFQMDGMWHHGTMQGIFVENGVFRLHLNQMLNNVQQDMYERYDRTTYDRMLYWFSFPYQEGLAAFPVYDICAYDAAGESLGRWHSAIS